MYWSIDRGCQLNPQIKKDDKKLIWCQQFKDQDNIIYCESRQHF